MNNSLATKNVETLICLIFLKQFLRRKLKNNFKLSSFFVTDFI